ncbi:uncharacterized protein [Lolium perenne]|uniref:uncharacterized protein isoform X2 n=1 Tax=Lolium perenne TaxID=4522 RepID=UPI0021F4FF9F|nr:uncharacterized protein LOC127331645 isoform X2 [Lolium perenne]
MACALLPAGAAAALSSPRWSAAASTKGHPNQVGCMNHLHQLHLKLPLAESHGSRSLVGCCITSRLSAEAATSSRSADASSSGKDVSMGDSVGTVSGAPIVISGYWIGPDMDDGCGHIQAILQRIS